MALAASSHVSLSTAGSSTARGCPSKAFKFSNGELMGLKLKLNVTNPRKRISARPICMSLTADFATQSKIKDPEQEQRDASRASDFGLMKIDDTGRVLFFNEKPKGDEIASMGVYIFKKEILLNLLKWRFPTANDFGSEIIPASAQEFFTRAYLFNDYWEDIGTIKSFFEANLALTAHPPRFSFYDAQKPMYTSRRNLPPSKIDNSKIVDSIISHGSFINNSYIDHSVVGIRSRINSNVHLKDTVMLGADFYETDKEVASMLADGKVPVGIGENTKIKNCIIDKNARIGKNVVIANSEGIQEADRTSEGFYIRSGITIIFKNSTMKDGIVI